MSRKETLINPVDHEIDNSIAAILSMMIPGLGQMLKGQYILGIVWPFLIGGGYLMNTWVGLPIHVLCILDAGLSGSNVSGETKIKKYALYLGVIVLLVYTCLRTDLFIEL